MKGFITAEKAVEMIRTDDVLAVDGFSGYGSCEALLRALVQRFRETGAPRNLTVYKGVSLGNFTEKGLARLSVEDGLVGTIFGGHAGQEPITMQMISENRCYAYLIPLGTVSSLLRAIASRKPGVVTRTGLKTFADPRLGGGKANRKTKESGKDIVQLLTIDGEEMLFYKTFPINACFIRGSYADEDGNISLIKEAQYTQQLEMASAVHSSGGLVFVQVAQVVKRGTLRPKEVHVPKFLVDYVVCADAEDSRQNLDNDYRPELTGEVQIPLQQAAKRPLDCKKICARRAAMELGPDYLVNLGIGTPEVVAAVANEEGISDCMTLSVEAGVFGGVPQGNLAFGAAQNPEAILKMADTLDIYDGGGLNYAVLGAAEIDARGNVNVSSFAGKAVGPGGFVDISQNTPKICFVGTFTTGGLQVETGSGALNILAEGRNIKFKAELEEVTFSAEYALAVKQTVLYCTERAVFRLAEQGIELIEIAPGVDLQKDILDHMEFTPVISPDLKLMDRRIFVDAPMGLTVTENA